jgi:hypothetical protein
VPAVLRVRDVAVAGELVALVAVLAATLAGAAMRRASAAVQAFAPSGWRNVPALPQQAAFAGRAGDVEVAYALGADGSFTGAVAGRPVGGRLLGAQVRPDGSGANSTAAISEPDMLAFSRLYTLLDLPQAELDKYLQRIGV